MTTSDIKPALAGFHLFYFAPKMRQMDWLKAPESKNSSRQFWVLKNRVFNRDYLILARSELSKLSIESGQIEWHTLGGNTVGEER